ncbi:hypothetical protein QTI66_32595 [Variovorax sp. J22R133]|uniref:hypothetical protein n=1 Tax=Variovorax brevis TaxID=3053503 RepID=UPI0025788EA7|nr:hypothetical protein [Variovorax sp. J22R133]MDM0116867.1 hypothetical protein [Variovorax sp. J22R133]
MIAAARMAARKLPANNKLDLPSAIGLMWLTIRTSALQGTQSIHLIENLALARLLRRQIQAQPELIEGVTRLANMVQIRRGMGLFFADHP